MIRIRRFSFIFSLIICLLTLSGCAGMEAVNDMMSSVTDLFADDDNADPPAVLPEEFQGEIQIDMLWKESVGDGADQIKLKLIPAISASRLYVADHKGLLQARQLAGGDLIWETRTSYPFAAGPVIGQQYLIIGSSHGEVVAYDFATGEQKWSTTVSSEVLAVPVVTKGKIILRTTDGKIIVLSESDGALLWSAEHSVPALSIRGAGAPLVQDDVMIFGCANGKLMALQLSDGKTLWEVTITIPSGRSEVERLVDLDTDPIAAHGTLFISSYQGGTSAVSSADGEVIWRNDNVSTYTGITADYRYLYLSDNRSEVWQLDQRNGAALWKQKELHNRQLTEAVVYQNYVVVGDFEGYVHWLSTADGRLMGRIKISKEPIEARPVIVDGIVYIYAKDGTLAALRTK
ncbi:MAG: outer membrane protein assembly factor BamB [Methylococcales bacterium]|nr:outer membrane protein assembly factor BamB [Methylococcales bacterium]